MTWGGYQRSICVTDGKSFHWHEQLGIFVRIQAELGVIGRAEAELQKERSEVSIKPVEVTMIHHGCGLHDPGIALIGSRVMALLSAVDGALPLRLPHEHHSLVLSKSSPVLVGDFVLALTFAKAMRTPVARHPKANMPREHASSVRSRGMFGE